jgi:hypothetical protein
VNVGIVRFDAVGRRLCSQGTATLGDKSHFGIRVGAAEPGSRSLGETPILLKQPISCLSGEVNTLLTVGQYLPLSSGHQSPPVDGLSEAEAASHQRLRQYGEDGKGYLQVQGIRPQTLAYGLTDWPAGQLAGGSFRGAAARLAATPFRHLAEASSLRPFIVPELRQA